MHLFLGSTLKSYEISTCGGEGGYFLSYLINILDSLVWNKVKKIYVSDGTILSEIGWCWDIRSQIRLIQFKKLAKSFNPDEFHLEKDTIPEKEGR